MTSTPAAGQCAAAHTRSPRRTRAHPSSSSSAVTYPTPAVCMAQKPTSSFCDTISYCPILSLQPKAACRTGRSYSLSSMVATSRTWYSASHYFCAKQQITLRRTCLEKGILMSTSSWPLAPTFEPDDAARLIRAAAKPPLGTIATALTLWRATTGFKRRAMTKIMATPTI